jgi:hypothetical protein
VRPQEFLQAQLVQLGLERQRPERLERQSLVRPVLGQR